MGERVPYHRTLGFGVWGWSRFVPGPVYCAALSQRQFTDRVVARESPAQGEGDEQASRRANELAEASPWSRQDLDELERLTALLEECGRRAARAHDRVHAFISAHDPEGDIRLEDRDAIPELYQRVLALRGEDSSYVEEARAIGEQIRRLVGRVTGDDGLVPWTEDPTEL